MRKLRLEFDELQVQSFATEERAQGKRGTVRAHSAYWTGPGWCTDEYGGTCGQDTCDMNGSCPALSCAGCGSDRCTGSETNYYWNTVC